MYDTFNGAASDTVVIDEDVISLYTPYVDNYYHFMIDGLIRCHNRHCTSRHFT